MRYGNNYKSTAHTLGSAAVILPQNPDRVALILFNTSGADCTFRIGSTGNITIKNGDHVAFLDRPPINAITATGTGTLVSWEA